MTTSDIIILSFFIFCFVGLAAVLAWGDYQTHDIAKAGRERALAGTLPPEPALQPSSESPLRLVEEKKPERTRVHA